MKPYPIAAFALLLAAPLGAKAAVIHESFTQSPLSSGWRVAGDSSLFHWNQAEGRLEVTWDSSRPNSFFHLPLGVVLSSRDDFRFALDLRPTSIFVGPNPDKPWTFELGFGLISRADATSAGFVRGAAPGPINLVEWDFFPQPADSLYSSAISTTIVTSARRFFPSFTTQVDLTPGDTFHIELRYTASTRTLATRMTRNGGDFGSLESAVLKETGGDFRVDAFSLSSYSDVGQDPAYAGSILATGEVDNVELEFDQLVGPSIEGRAVGATWRVTAPAIPGFWYQLERSRDLAVWERSGEPVRADGTWVELIDSQPWTTSGAFYRLFTAQWPP